MNIPNINASGTMGYSAKHSNVAQRHGTWIDKIYRVAQVIFAASVLHATSAAIGIAMVCAMPLDVAAAQSSAASLSGITVAGGGAGETKVLLSFNQSPPDFSIAANDSDRVTLSFPSAVWGSNTRVPPPIRGVLKAIESNQDGASLTVSFVGLGPIHIDAKAAASGGVSLSITASKGAADRGVGGAELAPANGPTPAFVDRNPKEDTFEIVPLKFADISEVVGLLSAGQAIKSNDNFTPEEPPFGSSGVGSNGGVRSNNGLMAPTYNPNVADAAVTAYGQMIDDSIGVDRRLNAIVLRGPPERIALLKAKIAALDVPVVSVLLETTFVELTETGAHNIGLDFNNAQGQIAVATYGSGNFANTSNSGYGGGGVGVNAAGYGSYQLQAAIFAQVQKGEGRIVSRPRISAQSGRSAKIVTGDALPILTSIALSGINAVSQEVQYVNVGVTLQIAPRVSSDGYVTTHIFAEVSSVTGYSQGYPAISQREASTSATVKDGDYFIIGGLTQESHLKTRGRVPVLGDVPLAGELFKLHHENQSKTELYIVITPHIVRDGDSEIARAETIKR